MATLITGGDGTKIPPARDFAIPFAAFALSRHVVARFHVP
jgi:hypothetical protein